MVRIELKRFWSKRIVVRPPGSPVLTGAKKVSKRSKIWKVRRNLKAGRIRRAIEVKVKAVRTKQAPVAL